MNLIKLFAPLLCYICFARTVWCLGFKDVILEPLDKSAGEDICVIFMQGADITPLQYVPLLKLVQEELSEYRVWVGIPDYFKNSVNPLDIDRGIQRVMTAMKDSGMSTNKFFYGGHSLGGAMIQTWVHDHAIEVSGQFLLGSFLTRVWKDDYVFKYSVPTLSVGGELDGLARVTRLAEAFYTQLQDPASTAVTSFGKDAFQSFPVTIIRGSTHMQFASGEPPKLVAERDLLPEISTPEAHARIAFDVAAFIKVRINGDAAAVVSLKSRVRDSEQFVEPIISAMQYEGYHNFRPPCLCGTDICEPQPNCTAACPFTSSISQPTMGSGLEGLTINDIDSFHDVWETKPEVHLPVVTNSCTQPSGCTLNMQTVTQAVYHTGEDLEVWKKHFDIPFADTGYMPITAVELRTKMNSRESVYTKAGQSNVSFDETDGDHRRCSEINQKAIDYALSHVGKDTASRFAKFGQPYQVADDIDVCAAGPCWIWKELQYDVTDDGNAVSLSSPQFVTPVDFWLKMSAGFHYCKILSPARAVEWMYVDGLRAKYSLNLQK